MKLGDKCKKYEMIETEQRFIPNVPLYIRIDGRGFSKFTKKMKKPFDEDMSFIMQETTKAVMKEFNCVVAYTQSDEMSFIIDGSNSEDGSIAFDYKKQKLVSSMAAFASSTFTYLAIQYFPEITSKRLPTFDCRIFSVPKNEAVENLIWRVRDCMKNSMTMAASSVYSHNELQGKNTDEKREMLKDKGVEFNDYPLAFREGVFFKNVQIEREIPDDIWSKIPDDNKPKSRTFLRTEIQDCKIYDFESMPDKQNFVFSKYSK